MRKFSSLYAVVLSSLVFTGCAHKAPEVNTAPVVEPAPVAPPLTPVNDTSSQEGWVEHTAGVWTFKLPPQFQEMDAPEGIDAFYKSENDRMLVAMGVEDLTEPMDVDQYATSFIAGMEANGAAIVGDLKGASSDEAKMGGMETDAVVFLVNHKSLLIHFVAVGNNKAYNFECGTGALLPKQNKTNFKTCLAIETTIKIGK